MSSTSTTKKGNQSSFSFHEGLALLKLADTYPKLIDVIYEGVQNALDSQANSVFINIDYRHRLLTISDNGNGVTVEKFNKALTSVGHTIKADDDSLGQFGLGLISPLGKCKEFTFTSTYKTSITDYKCWRFVSRDISNRKKVDAIPFKEVDNQVFGPGLTSKNGKTYVPWRTQLKLLGFSVDRTISKIELNTLKEEILVKFGAKMRKLNTSIAITIQREDKSKETDHFFAPEFSGQKLQLVQYTGKDGGKSSFEMYVARRTNHGRKGVIHVGIKGNDYRINFKTFSYAADLLTSESLEVFNSGVFEGTILSEKCTLAKERNRFEENDALVEFCNHIEAWAQLIGSGYIKQINDERENERYQRLGSKSLQKLAEMFNNPDYENFKEIFSNIKQGGDLGSGEEKSENRSDSVEENKPPMHEKSQENEEGKKKETSGSDTRSPRRRIVRHQNGGLQFVYEEMSGKNVLWEFEPETGILRFNIRHPLWEKAEKKDHWLMQFQEHIAIGALTIQLMPKEQRFLCRQFVQEELACTLYLIENR